MKPNPDPIDPQEADRLMGCVLEHYIKHYDAVLRKLGHAKTATQKSIKTISEADHNAQALGEVKAYDGMWEKVIALFQEAGISEEELGKIETILGGMPRIIMKYYEVLVKQDEVLQALIAELDSDIYREAIARTRQVQGRPDLMSGLDPAEFDLQAQALHKHAFLFKAPVGRG